MCGTLIIVKYYCNTFSNRFLKQFDNRPIIIFPFSRQLWPVLNCQLKKGSLVGYWSAKPYKISIKLLPIIVDKCLSVCIASQIKLIMHEYAIRKLQLSESDDQQFINYFTDVNERGKKYHILPWHSVALMNCNSDGSVINLNESKLFNQKGSKLKPWVLMKLKLFYIEVMLLYNYFWTRILEIPKLHTPTFWVIKNNVYWL